MNLFCQGRRGKTRYPCRFSICKKRAKYKCCTINGGSHPTTCAYPKSPGLGLKQTLSISKIYVNTYMIHSSPFGVTITHIICVCTHHVSVRLFRWSVRRTSGGTYHIDYGIDVWVLPLQEENKTNRTGSSCLFLSLL